MGYEAGVKAMLDAHITYDDVETGVACYCYGDTTSGQRIFYQFGMSTVSSPRVQSDINTANSSRIPIYNTNNACATGSTGLFLGRTLIKNGAADCVMVIGFEQMQPGSIKSVWSDRPSPMGLSSQMMEDTHGKHDSPRNAQYFANAGNEYMDKSVLPLHLITARFPTNPPLDMAINPTPSTPSPRSAASPTSTAKQTPTPSSATPTPTTRSRTRP
jgi:sterol carrier protein 2